VLDKTGSFNCLSVFQCKSPVASYHCAIYYKPDHPENEWPPNSADLNPLDYCVCGLQCCRHFINLIQIADDHSVYLFCPQRKLSKLDIYHIFPTENQFIMLTVVSNVRLR